MSDPVGVSAMPTAYSNSVGNQLLFPEVKSKRNRNKKQVQDIMNRNQPIISRSDAMRQILETSKAKCSCAAKPCLEKISPTWEGCVDAFLSCRSHSRFKLHDLTNIDPCFELLSQMTPKRPTMKRLLGQKMSCLG